MPATTDAKSGSPGAGLRPLPSLRQRATGTPYGASSAQEAVFFHPASLRRRFPL